MFSHNMLFLVYIADYLTADASWECEQELNDGFFSQCPSRLETAPRRSGHSLVGWRKVYDITPLYEDYIQNGSGDGHISLCSSPNS